MWQLKCSCCRRILPADNFITVKSTYQKVGTGTLGRMKITSYEVQKPLCLDCYYYMKPIKRRFNIAIIFLAIFNAIAMAISYKYYHVDTKIYLWWLGGIVVLTWFIWAIREIYSDSKARKHNANNPFCEHTVRPKDNSSTKEMLQGCSSLLVIAGIIFGIYRCNSQHKKEIEEWNKNVGFCAD